MVRKDNQQAYFSFLLLLFFSCCCIQCQLDGKINTKTYYFPLHDLYDGLTYEYRAIDNDALPPYYWYYRTIDQEESTFLTGMYYDYQFIPQQFIREERIRNGMLLEESFIYDTDTLNKQNQISVAIESGTSFPFEVTDSLGVFLYNINWFLPSDSTTYTLIRNRRYKGKTTFEYQEKTYPAIEFSVRELIETEKEGFLKIELEGTEIYAQGIGLVYVSKKEVDGNFEQTYQLYDRYPMEDLEAKFGKSMEL